MPAEFSILRRVHFADTDMAGLVHFTNYFHMMEEVEHAYFRSLGLSVVMDHGGVRISWPRVATACQFFGPARFEDEIELKLRVTRIGEKSLSYEVDFLIQGRKVALGSLTSVCCTQEDGQMHSVPIPPDIRARFGSPA